MIKCVKYEIRTNAAELKELFGVRGIIRSIKELTANNVWL